MIYYTGCDAHRSNCTFQHMDAEGALGLNMTTKTDKDDISRFLDLLDEPTVMTLEAGRNWWFLHQLFSQHPNVSDVLVVDPRRSRNIAKELSVLSGYGRASNDRIDSEMLAEQTRNNLAPAIHVPSPQQLELRTLNRHRLVSVVSNTRYKNSIHAILAMHGQSISMDSLLKDPDEKIRLLQSVPDFVSFIISHQLDRIYLFQNHIVACDHKLNTLLPESHPQMKIILSAPGFGPIIARIIISEIFNISYFPSHKYLNSYAGLAPICEDSAGRKKSKPKLNPHCNYYLKYAFVEAAHHAASHPKYRRKYELDVKKHGPMIAKLNLARRLVKTIYWMLTRQQSFQV